MKTTRRITRLTPLVLAPCFFVNPLASRAGTFPVHGFDQITGNMFFDLPANNILPIATLGSVTVTPNPGSLNGSFGDFLTSETAPAVPGDRAGAGWFGIAGDHPLTLNFSQPVAAFGATLVHQLGRPGFDDLVTVKVFSGPNGTGVLLGAVTDSLGGATTSQASADFVGLWSINLDIQSAVVDSASPGGGYAIDGYAVGLITAVPEPEMPLFTTLAMLALAVRWLPRLGSERGRRTTLEI